LDIITHLSQWNCVEIIISRPRVPALFPFHRATVRHAEDHRPYSSMNERAALSIENALLSAGLLSTTRYRSPQISPL